MQANFCDSYGFKIGCRTGTFVVPAKYVVCTCTYVRLAISLQMWWRHLQEKTYGEGAGTVQSSCVQGACSYNDCKMIVRGRRKLFFCFLIWIFMTYTRGHVGHSHGRLNCILKKIPLQGSELPPWLSWLGLNTMNPNVWGGMGIIEPLPSLSPPNSFWNIPDTFQISQITSFYIYSPLCAFANFKVQFSFCRNQRVTTIWIGYQPLNTPVVCGVGLHYHWALQRASSYRFGLSHLTPSPFVGGCDITEPLFPATDLL